MKNVKIDISSKKVGDHFETTVKVTGTGDPGHAQPRKFSHPDLASCIAEGLRWATLLTAAGQAIAKSGVGTSFDASIAYGGVDDAVVAQIVAAEKNLLPQATGLVP